MLTAVVFDLDGTLVDSAASILAGFADALRTHGLAPAVPLDSALIGPPLAVALARLVGTQDARVLTPLIQSFKDWYDVDGYRATQVFPGVEHMLSRLADAGLELHIATHKRRAPTLSILAHLGWSSRFASVFCSDSLPQPFADKGDMLRLQLAAQALPAASTVYVGDRYEDGRAADANALAFYLARWATAETFAAEHWPRHWIAIESPGELLRRTGVLGDERLAREMTQ